MGSSHNEKHVLESRWGMGTCAKCGATVVLGERFTHEVIGGRWELLCSTCASEPASALRNPGYEYRMLDAA
jgi:hypothetical protein